VFCFSLSLQYVMVQFLCASDIHDTHRPFKSICLTPVCDGVQSPYWPFHSKLSITVVFSTLSQSWNEHLVKCLGTSSVSIVFGLPYSWLFLVVEEWHCLLDAHSSPKIWSDNSGLEWGSATLPMYLLST
jgi:hypothetical protein